MLTIQVAAGVLLASLVQSIIGVVFIRFRQAAQLKQLQARLAELKVREDEDEAAH